MKIAIAGALVVATLLAGAPAEAQGWHHGWRHRHYWRHHYWRHHYWHHHYRGWR